MLRSWRFTTMLGVSSVMFGARVMAQGVLLPAGAPAPSMKTLEQVEPRTPISSLPFVITNSGSYYLTSNLGGLDGIAVKANDVDLDLNGFMLTGAPGAGAGVYLIFAVTSLRVHNGTVRGWGEGGVSAGGASNSQFEDLRLIDNAGDDGLSSGADCTIRNCLAQGNGVNGIDAGADNAVSGCTANRNGNNGIACLLGTMVSDSTASVNTNSGFAANGSGSMFSRCVSRNNFGPGINIGFRAAAVDSIATSNGGDGILASGEARLEGNTCEGNGVGVGIGAGILVSGNGGRITGNLLCGNDRGLDIDGTANYVDDNTVRANTDNYDFAAGNQLNLLLGQIPESIDWPAVVTMAGSLTGVAGTHGILINSDNVTLDLGGHDLIGVPGSSNGIAMPQTLHHNIVVQNGTIRNWGEDGVDIDSTRGGRAIGLIAYTNGWSSTLKAGLRLGSASVVKDCVSHGNESDGMWAGLDCNVSGCSAYQNGRYGLRAGSGCTVVHCAATDNGGGGIVAAEGSLISECAAQRDFDGIVVYDNCQISACSADDNDRNGIMTVGDNNRIDGNYVTRNQTGISVAQSGNFIVRNTAVGNSSAGYSIAGGNKAAQVIAPGAAFVSTDPWANFAY